EVRLARRLEHVDEMIAARVDVGFDVIRDVRREEHRHHEPGDEGAADDRQIEHGTSSATGNCSKAAPTAIVRSPSASSASIVAPVNTSRNERPDTESGSSMRVSPQTLRPVGGAAPSGVSVASRRGTQVIERPPRAKANTHSRRDPAAISALYLPCS